MIQHGRIEAMQRVDATRSFAVGAQDRTFLHRPEVKEVGAHTRTCKHTHAHARTHTHTRTHTPRVRIIVQLLEHIEAIGATPDAHDPR
jgi:hypothetical protein